MQYILMHKNIARLMCAAVPYITLTTLPYVAPQWSWLYDMHYIKITFYYIAMQKYIVRLMCVQVQIALYCTALKYTMLQCIVNHSQP